MRTSDPIAASLVLLLGGCGSAAPATAPATAATTAPTALSVARGPDSVETLFDADRRFAQDAALDRAEGWVAWFDANAAKVPIEGEPLQGTPAIRAQAEALFADPAIELRWDPEVGAMIDPGRLGFTRGRYELVRITDDGESALGTGTYLTVWHWTAEGWRVALDTGVPDGEG